VVALSVSLATYPVVASTTGGGVEDAAEAAPDRAQSVTVSAAAPVTMPIVEDNSDAGSEPDARPFNPGVVRQWEPVALCRNMASAEGDACKYANGPDDGDEIHAAIETSRPF
jgi:hypothetical protein